MNLYKIVLSIFACVHLMCWPVLAKPLAPIEDLTSRMSILSAFHNWNDLLSATRALMTDDERGFVMTKLAENKISLDSPIEITYENGIIHLKGLDSPMRVDGKSLIVDGNVIHFDKQKTFAQNYHLIEAKLTHKDFSILNLFLPEAQASTTWGSTLATVTVLLGTLMIAWWFVAALTVTTSLLAVCGLALDAVGIEIAKLDSKCGKPDFKNTTCGDDRNFSIPMGNDCTLAVSPKNSKNFNFTLSINDGGKVKIPRETMESVHALLPELSQLCHQSAQDKSNFIHQLTSLEQRPSVSKALSSPAAATAAGAP